MASDLRRSQGLLKSNPPAPPRRTCYRGRRRTLAHRRVARNSQSLKTLTWQPFYLEHPPSGMFSASFRLSHHEIANGMPNSVHPTLYSGPQPQASGAPKGRNTQSTLAPRKLLKTRAGVRPRAERPVTPHFAPFCTVLNRHRPFSRPAPPVLLLFPDAQRRQACPSRRGCPSYPPKRSP